jgi:hypothetical protein
MTVFLKIFPVVLYFSVGLICLAMAIKCLVSDKFLPFHEKAAGEQRDEIEEPLQLVILSFLRLAGLGFLVVAILLMACPVVNYFLPNIFYTYAVPAIALIFCMGLLINNYNLYKRTKADTPWRGSLYAMILIIAGIVVSVFN